MTPGGQPQGATLQLPDSFRILRYDSLDSTNDEARRLAEDPAAGWLAVWAERQTSGRGRQARPWTSPAGNLYVSYLIQPTLLLSDCDLARAAQLSFAAALAVGDAVRSLAPADLQVSYKWPNDVLFNGRKGVGILLESCSTSGGGLRSLIVGIGVNIAVGPAEARYPATYLRAEGCDGSLTPASLLEAMSASLLKWLALWASEGFTPLRDAWCRSARGLGEQIEARLPQETLTGRFADLDVDGTLLLTLPSGATRQITAGDIYFIE